MGQLGNITSPAPSAHRCCRLPSLQHHPGSPPRPLFLPYIPARITAHKWASTPLRALLSVTGKLLVHVTEIKQVGIIICSSSPFLCNSQFSNVGLGFKCIWSGTYFLVLNSNNVILTTIRSASACLLGLSFSPFRPTVTTFFFLRV